MFDSMNLIVDSIKEINFSAVLKDYQVFFSVAGTGIVTMLTTAWQIRSQGKGLRATLEQQQKENLDRLASDKELAYQRTVADRKNHQTKNAVEIMNELQVDPEFKLGQREIAKLAQTDDNKAILIRLGQMKSREFGVDTRKQIAYVLNRLEYMCVGIEKGTYSEEIIFLCYKTETVRIFDLLTPFINGIRTEQNAPKAWEYLEHIAERWRKADSFADIVQENQ